MPKKTYRLFTENGFGMKRQPCPSVSRDLNKILIDQDDHNVKAGDVCLSARGGWAEHWGSGLGVHVISGIRAAATR